MSQKTTNKKKKKGGRLLFLPGGALSRERMFWNTHKMHQEHLKIHQEADELEKEEKVAWVPTFEEVLEASEEKQRIDKVMSRIDSKEDPLPVSREEFEKTKELLEEDNPKRRQQARLAVKFRQMMTRLVKEPSVWQPLIKEARACPEPKFLFFPAAKVKDVDPDIKVESMIEATGAEMIRWSSLEFSVQQNFKAAPRSFVNLMHHLHMQCIIAVSSGQDIVVWTVLHPDVHPFVNGAVEDSVAMELPDSVQMEFVFRQLVASARFRSQLRFELGRNKPAGSWKSHVVAKCHEDYLLANPGQAFEFINKKDLRRAGDYQMDPTLWKHAFQDWRVLELKDRILPTDEGVTLLVYGPTITIFTQIYWNDDPQRTKHRYLGVRASLTQAEAETRKKAIENNESPWHEVFA